MTTEYKLNTLIEWTHEDRAKGECPVPNGSDVTVWLSDGRICRAKTPEGWGKGITYIIAYLIHSIPREPIVRHLFIDEFGFELLFSEKSVADDLAKENGGRVVKMMEVINVYS